MLKKKDFDDAAVIAALRRGQRQRTLIAVFRHKFMNYSGQTAMLKIDIITCLFIKLLRQCILIQFHCFMNFRFLF